MKKILIINANYYKDISKKLVLSASRILQRKSYKISLMHVTGVLEIPIAIRKNVKKFDAFVVLGCVIKGKTPHFELICNSTFNAILNLSITFNKPIGNGIITALNKKQALERCGKIKTNKPNKGSDAVKAILSILENGTKKI